MANRTILIIGGGASGALAATALIDADASISVTIIEPREKLGRGVAYSTPYEEHLLNVPASRMSAFADEPAHFVAWLREQYGERFAPASFVPRAVYGDYLETVVAETAKRAGPRFRHLRAVAISIDANDSGVTATCSDGSVE